MKKTYSQKIYLQYQGFLDTPFLWNTSFYGLQQIQLTTILSHIFEGELTKNTRLGKRVESFVSCYLQQFNNITVLHENIQIQQNKITLGELDCLLYKDEKLIHLEIIYKFYLYDETVGESEIEHFIGPNRKDSLLEKLTKLKEKQLPLLYSNQCKLYLESIDLDVSKIEQQVYFKAQLFVPFSKRNVKLSTLNPDCVVGFYINQQEMQQFTDCKFYIPNKKDWLIIPHANVNWINFEVFATKIQPYLERQFSPLIWIKNKNGTIKKAFLVWW